MAKKNKDARVQVILECTEQKNSGVPGMSRNNIGDKELWQRKLLQP